MSDHERTLAFAALRDIRDRVKSGDFNRDGIADELDHWIDALDPGDVIDWTGPAADVYDQLITRWWQRHPEAGEDRTDEAAAYADDMVGRYLR